MGAPVPREIDLDAAGVAIASGLCLLVSVLFGLLPAVRFSSPNLIPALKDDAGGGGRRPFACIVWRRWCRSASPCRFS